MQILEISNDTLHLNPEEEHPINGEETGVLFYNGRNYRVIDEAIAVREYSTVEKILNWLKSYGLMYGGVGLGLGGVLGMAALGNPVVNEALFFGAILLPFAGLISFLWGAYNVLQNTITPDRFQEVKQKRSIIDYAGLMNRVKTRFNQNEERLLDALQEKEIRKLFAYESESLSFTDIIDKVGFELALKYLPEGRLLSAFNKEVGQISDEELERFELLLGLYSKVGKERGIRQLTKGIEEGALKGFEKIKNLFDVISSFLDANRRVKVVMVPAPALAPVHHYF